MEKAPLIECIKRLSQSSVMVIGDIAIDEMIVGETSRLSREAPVIILRHENTDILLGAGGNAAHNLSALGAKKVTMVGVAGKDYYCSLLFEAMERDGISIEGMVQDESRPTVTKTRISGKARQSVLQQIVRIDRESTVPISKKVEDELVDKIHALLPEHDAVIISDYKLGVLTDRVIETCRLLAAAKGMVLAADSHRDLALFHGATIATPNLPEAENNLGHPLPDNAAIVEGGLLLKAKARLQNLLITRGSDGMTLFETNGQIHHIPPFNRSEVFDVTGAGDTVIGALTLALASGASTLEAAILGNLAASIVVKKYGTAVTTPQELLETLADLDDNLLRLESSNAAV